MCITKRLAKLLRNNKLKIATAESCTAGLLSAALTDIPGSSEYFSMGVTVYSNETKTRTLNVKNSTLVHNGAVSKETALEMAWGIKKLAESNIGVSITGIAGPGGGTLEKPVGLVYIGIVINNYHFVKKLSFLGNRNAIRKQAVNSALKYLLVLINKVR